MLDKLEIARALREIGMLLQIQGENPFKARAYENGALAMEELDEDVARVVAEDRLTRLRGIGAALAAQIAELHRTGRSTLLDRLRAELPPGVLELSQIQGLSVKKIQALHEALGVASVEDLERACQTGQVRGVKGFGDKTEQKILDAIHHHKTRDERVRLVDALEVAEPLLAHVRACPAAADADFAGELRRFRETVLGAPIVAATKDPEALLDWAARFPRVSSVDTRDETGCSLRLSGGLRAAIHAVPPARYAAALLHHTGSSAHLAELAARAEERGLALGESGLARPSGKLLAAKTEKDLYAHLGLAYVPPELREGEGEIAEAAANARLDDLVVQDDIQGMVHCHTVYSDGKATIEEMARAAEAMGMKYITITDHSPAAHYANGVPVDRLKRQWDEIARVQELVKVRLLRGTESDILDTGALDYPDAILEQLEVVIASIHSRMKMDADQMTRRLVNAMRQPVFKIWGHPLGRLLQRREPFACHVEEVLDAIAASRAAIEVNGDPYRLDMEPRWIKEARRRGIRFVVSTDAHSVSDMENLRFGVGIARRGGLSRGEVLNTMDVGGFAKAVRPAA